jgi:myo-inositol 2-dehydrogenase/D-chiro-inositol 1-dehydrogenase
MINVGIIGIGRIGRVHGESITKYVKNARVKAVADPFLNDNGKAWAQSLGITETYTDYKKILADPAIEAVLICASTDQHSPISLEALKAGKHVFCEKPIDHSVEKIKEVLQAVDASGKKYQVGFNRRFDHNFAAVQKAVAEGKVGQQQIIKITSRDPEPPSIDYVKISGGIFLDMTIHDFDMVRYLSGAEVEEVYAAGSVTVDPAIGQAGDIDTAIITLKLDMDTINELRYSARQVLLPLPTIPLRQRYSAAKTASYKKSLYSSSLNAICRPMLLKSMPLSNPSFRTRQPK